MIRPLLGSVRRGKLFAEDVIVVVAAHLFELSMRSPTWVGSGCALERQIRQDAKCAKKNTYGGRLAPR
jgi:hypothetical protein